MPITALNLITLRGFSNSIDEYLSKLLVQPTIASIVITNTLINSLKNTGNWYILDDLHIFATEQPEHGFVNLVHPEYPIASLVDSPTFTANRGFQMDGVNDAINSGFSPPQYRRNYQQNSASIFVWSRTTGQSNTPDMGGRAGAELLYLRCRSTANAFQGRINDASLESATTTHTDGSGFFMVNRPDASTKQFFKGNSKLGNDVPRASTGILNLAGSNPYYGASQAGTFGIREIAAGGIGGSHTETQALNLYNALAAYMTAVGA